MRFPSRLRWLGGLLAFLWLAGCMPLPDRDDEEKNPLIGDARAKKAAYNYQGAVDSLEKALEGNPRLALAHWELGLIFTQNLPDPAAGIYHFEKLLKLRPSWRHAETARQMINVCKIELAKNVPLGPQSPAMQHQLDKLVEKVFELTNEANRLRTQNTSLALLSRDQANEIVRLRELVRGYAAAQAAASAPTNLPPARTVPPTSAPETRPPGPAVSAPTAQGAPNPSKPTGPAPAATRVRQHTVQAGETMAKIAQRYGLKLRSLVVANPNVSPERLRVGQVLRIPES